MFWQTDSTNTILEYKIHANIQKKVILTDIKYWRVGKWVLFWFNKLLKLGR